MKKAKINYFCKKHITADTIKVIILFVPLTVLLIRQIRNGSFEWKQYLDTSILVSFLLVFLCDAIASRVTHFVGKKCEDASKLSEDYKSMTKKYCREKLLVYQEHAFPVICLALRKISDSEFNMNIDQNNKKHHYQLPCQIAKHSDYIMNAHSCSTVYNNMNVRLDDLIVNGTNITMFYSMTTYFDSLITNRAMDYKLQNGKTIREIYEPGPFLSKLSESKLSNHLGFNGFVETSDNKFIFVLRNNNLSIGKNTLADSIGASLKTKYCLNDAREFTLEDLSNSIRSEIFDELRIQIDDDDLYNTIFAFYRDIVEGGKPQFLFHYKLKNMTQQQFENNIAEIKKSVKMSLKRNATIDGSKYVYLSLDQLRQCTITSGQLTFPNNGGSYPMMPSASASIVMLLRYFEDN